MGFREEMMNEREAQEAPKKGKKNDEVVEERLLAGSKNYDYYNMGSQKPIKGGNSW